MTSSTATPHLTTVRAVASEGLRSTGAQPNPPELEITTSGNLQLIYDCLMDMDTIDVVFRRGRGEESDCWFGPNGEGPYSDLIFAVRANYPGSS